MLAFRDVTLNATFVPDTSSEFSRRSIKLVNYRMRAPRDRQSLALLSAILLAALCAFCSCVPTYAANFRIDQITTAGRGLPYAIADFDGDVRPDVATVEGADYKASGTTRYRIQLRFSHATSNSIQLVAPAGGLVLEARDVNGDQAPDLVLATAWQRQPVAIYLNDGHGQFSRAEPSTFRSELSSSNSNAIFPTSISAGACAIQRDRIAVSLGPSPPRVRSSPARLFSRAHIHLPGTLLFPHSGRAPPSELPTL